MSPKHNKYLPAWVPWCVSLFTVPAWVWLTYQVFCTEQGRVACGVGDWVLSSLIVAGVTLVIFLMGGRKLSVHYSRENLTPLRH
jgi:hypothetical protein